MEVGFSVDVGGRRGFLSLRDPTGGRSGHPEDRMLAPQSRCKHGTRRGAADFGKIGDGGSGTFSGQVRGKSTPGEARRRTWGKGE
jgi:hypothetical protein